MSATTKPTLVIVPGFWHTQYAYFKLATTLNSLGYETEIAELSTVGIRDPAPLTHRSDVDVVHGILHRLVNEQGKQVVLLAHNYGGLPASDAVQGYEASSSRMGGVVGVVFVSAFLPEKGQSLAMVLSPHMRMEDLPGIPDPDPEGKLQTTRAEIGPEIAYINENRMYCNAYRPRYWMYHDVDDLDSARFISELQPHNLACTMTLVESEAWSHVPCTFIQCELDRFIPLELQQNMVKRVQPKSKHPWTVSSLYAGLAAFANDDVLDELTGIIDDHVNAILKQNRVGGEVLQLVDKHPQTDSIAVQVT